MVSWDKACSVMFVLKLLAGAAFTKTSCVKIRLFQQGDELADMLCTMHFCLQKVVTLHLRALSGAFKSIFYSLFRNSIGPVRQRLKVALKCGRKCCSQAPSYLHNLVQLWS